MNGVHRMLTTVMRSPFFESYENPLQFEIKVMPIKLSRLLPQIEAGICGLKTRVEFEWVAQGCHSSTHPSE